MAKNDFARRLQERRQMESEITQLWTGQCCLDAMAIALNEEFGIGKDRLARLNERFDAIYKEALIGLSRSPEASHARRLVDERLAEIYGPNFEPWPARYDYWDDKGI